MNSKPIPKAFLDPLREEWDTSEYCCNAFALTLEYHADGDSRSGLTSRYIHREGGNNEMALKPTLIHKELKAMIATGLVPECFYVDNQEHRCIELNQHYQHSLEQFYSSVYALWEQHLERTQALIGTPAGRIHKRQDVAPRPRWLI
jgi:hypothetical protein